MSPLRSPETLGLAPGVTADADLARLLTASGAFAPLYERGALRLSNHLPMLLTALARLGAPADVLEAHWARVSPRLSLLSADPDAARAVEAWAQRLQHDGVAATVADALPGLLAAPETSAFHGPIRLAYALDAGHPGEIARALAAWSQFRWQAGRQAGSTAPGLVEDPPPGRAPGLRAALEAAAEAPALAFAAPRNTTIVQDMAACAALPGWAHFAQGDGAPADQALTLRAFAEASLGVYLATRDFTALHLVTAVHALRGLLASTGVDWTPPLRRHLWRAWFTTWLTVGRPAPDEQAVHQGAAGEADWSRQAAALHASPDEHRIKLAWSALCEWRHWGWPGYARVLDPVT